MVPSGNHTQCVFTLLIIVTCSRPVIDAQQRHAPHGAGPPDIQVQPVAFVRLVVNLLHQVQILYHSAFVSIQRVITACGNSGVVVGVFFLLVVTIDKVVARRCRCKSGRYLPSLPAIIQVEETVARMVGTSAEHRRQRQAARGGGLRAEQNGPSQPAAGGGQ